MEKTHETIELQKIETITALKIEFVAMRDDAKLPTTGIYRPGVSPLVLYSHCISESGSTMQRVLPPKTIKQIPTGISVQHSDEVRMVIHPLDYLLMSIPPLWAIITPHIEKDELFVLMYSGGHESAYLRHHSPLGELLFERVTAVRV